ncbi:hypothetical protein P691DRAFT_682384, partial [Macrolepiota fuliginosa MF-IS2]
LSVLKKDFETLQLNMSKRKAHLAQFLAQNEHISEEDEMWLNNEGNLVVES